MIFYRKLFYTGLNKHIFLTPEAETKTFFDSCVEGGSAMLSKNHKVGKVGWIEILKELQPSRGTGSNRKPGHTGPASNTAAKEKRCQAPFYIHFPPRLLSGKSSRTAPLKLFHKCGAGLKVLVKNYCNACSSISVRSKNSISWQIEVALIRKLRFHSFEGEVWSDTSKGFQDGLSWVGGLMAKGGGPRSEKKKSQIECGGLDAVLAVSRRHVIKEEMWKIVKGVRQEKEGFFLEAELIIVRRFFSPS